MTADRPTPLLVWGAAGHARMLRPTILRAGRHICALVDRRLELPSPFATGARLVDLAGVIDWLRGEDRGDVEYVVAIGGHNGGARRAIATELDALGLRPFTAVHERAWVADTAIIGLGTHVMPMAAVGEDAILGSQTIINTSASVDHECIVGAGVHLMPGATLAGSVIVGDDATIGSNATIFPRVRIGAGAQIGAGSVVTRDVAPGIVVVGSPARPR